MSNFCTVEQKIEVDIEVVATCQSCHGDLGVDVEFSRGSVHVNVKPCGCASEINTSSKFWSDLLDEFERRKGIDFRGELELFAITYLATHKEA